MKAVIQRVSKASVSVSPNYLETIGNGLLVFLGIEDQDTHEDMTWLAGKIINMRIFSDENGKMNLSLKDKNYEALIVSQFTLHASTKKGHRPSFIHAAKPEYALNMYNQFIDVFSKNTKNNVKTGIFGADMNVELINNGPVTIIIDSKNRV